MKKRENVKKNKLTDVTIQTKIYIFVYNLRFRELRLCTRCAQAKREKRTSRTDTILVCEMNMMNERVKRWSRSRNVHAPSTVSFYARFFPPSFFLLSFFSSSFHALILFTFFDARSRL